MTHTALSAKGNFLGDPRAWYLLGIETTAYTLQPETVDVKMLYATAGEGGACALIKTDQVINAANYSRIVPSNVIGVERVRTASLGSGVFRDRALLHYEHKDLELPELPRLAMPDGVAVAESLESHLVSKEETPQDSFVGDTVIRLQKPHHADDEDARSPITTGHANIGDVGSELFAGPLVTIGHPAGRWWILALGNTMTVIQQDHRAPYRRTIVMDDVVEQFAQKLKVYAPHTMTLQRTWPEPPVGLKVLAKRPAFPARASRVLARDMGSAIGAGDCWELDGDVDIQRTDANTVGAYMAKVVIHRTHTRLLQVANRLKAGKAGSDARVVVIYTTPAPPPLLTARSADN